MNDSDRYEYEHDRPLVEFLDACDTVAAFLGGDEGERVKAALYAAAHVPPCFARKDDSQPDLFNIAA